jgi:hypothetical protein
MGRGQLHTIEFSMAEAGSFLLKSPLKQIGYLVTLSCLANKPMIKLFQSALIIALPGSYLIALLTRSCFRSTL